MTLLEKIEAIIATANAASQVIDDTIVTYNVHYEDSRMENLTIDEVNQLGGVIHIEEFTSGKINTPFGKHKTESIKMQIYFAKCITLDDNARNREALRNEIKSEIVYPFITAYNNSGYFTKVTEWGTFNPPSRFDWNDCSVMLEFDCQQTTCLI